MKKVKFKDYKVGLVLSGGGAKGAYQLGIFKALDDLLLFDKVKVISGTSIGAMNALAYSCAENIKECEYFWNNLTYKEIFDSYKFAKDLPDLVKKSLDGGVFSFDLIINQLKDHIDILKMNKKGVECYSCAYDLEKDAPEYFYLNNLPIEDIYTIIAASAAVPYVFDPVEYNGKKYVDGGAVIPTLTNRKTDNVPIKPILDKDLDLVIIVYLNYSDQVDTTKIKGQYLEIRPSIPLESIEGLKTLAFVEKQINEFIELGHRDGLVKLGPLLVNLLS